MEPSTLALKTCNSLIDDQNMVSEERVLDILKKMPDYFVKHFEIPNDDYEGCLYEYEFWITTLGLRLTKGFKLFYPKYLKNSKIVHEIKRILENEKYAGGREGFIYLLQENKLDHLFVEIISNHPEFFLIPRLQFPTINSLVKRKIKGFENEVEQLFKTLDKRKDGARFYNICQKYLTDSVNYKRHFKDILG
ncbi:hypothetical protein [Sphingobacterium bovistauri]|uniref:Uncharacterized protein n=1 Tax=Sphingobacterium bovistauri TaxID=2781959 RepID=A0ABS7Z4U9_9SPHI|nr:hypothetical protein [Sphingobacterium bovistauri]MCA5005221.1 hypothetical protein [Sphingobacterium bovistauri]